MPKEKKAVVQQLIPMPLLNHGGLDLSKAAALLSSKQNDDALTLVRAAAYGDFPMYLEIRSGRGDNLQYLPYGTFHLHCIFHILPVEGCYMRVGCILLFAYSLARQFSP